MSNPMGKPDPGQSVRQPYEPPRVEALGTIAQITQGVAGEPGDNGPDFNGSVFGPPG